MAGSDARSIAIWELARRQHWVLTRTQLLDHGFSAKAIEHRLATGRLRRLWRGVYAAGRAEVDDCGRWLGAVLACGPDALLSHRSAGALWGLVRRHAGAVEVTAPRLTRAQPGIALHRGRGKPRAQRHGIPVTTPAATLVDLATQLRRDSLEAAISEADRLDLIDPETLREELESLPPRCPGKARLRSTLDRHTFRLTDSRLERLFLPIVRAAGLPLPDTRQRVNDFRVDFVWAGLGLVVETDGLRYHRTPSQQSKDLVRDHAHAASGLERLRFSHAQVRYEPDHVERTLRGVGRRLRAARPGRP